MTDKKEGGVVCPQCGVPLSVGCEHVNMPKVEGTFDFDREMQEMENDRLMMLLAGRPAFHKLAGNLGGREEDAMVWLTEEDDEYYRGQFRYGLGFIDVFFKKSDLRPLTAEEIAGQMAQPLVIAGVETMRREIDKDGYFKPDSGVDEHGYHHSTDEKDS